MNVYELDKKFVWHPCTQMKDHEIQPPIEIVKGEGSYLFDSTGKKYIDGISSWWVNLLGHCNPRLTAALQKQASELEHVIFAGFTHENGAKLAAELCRVAPGNPKKVFYSDCGSAAVEVALKMSFQYWKLSGKPRKKRFVSISGAYHGETLGALSVGGMELYRETFSPIMLDTFNVQGPDCFRCPFGKSRDNCAAECFAEMEKTLEKNADEIAAVFIEPLVQCANNMNIYSPVYLKKLREATARLGIHLVADEIAVGFGRTGKFFACEHVDVAPDFMCVSKGLTGGYMPFAATLVYDEDVYNAFYGEYTEYKAFYHSHSYTGNPMAARLGLEVVKIMEEEILPQMPKKINALKNMLDELAQLPNVGEVRQCGFIGAVELVADKKTKKSFPAEKRVGWNIYREALKRGALLRPLCDVIYFLAPLTTTDETLRELGGIAKESILKIIRKCENI